MIDKPHQGSRIPRDARARERLRDAQAREAAALAHVCAAENLLVRASARRDAVLAKASAQVDEARENVEAAQALLVRTSGLQRAALLLNAKPSDLRKVQSRRVDRAES